MVCNKKYLVWSKCSFQNTLVLIVTSAVVGCLPNCRTSRRNIDKHFRPSLFCFVSGSLPARWGVWRRTWEGQLALSLTSWVATLPPISCLPGSVGTFAGHRCWLCFGPPGRIEDSLLFVSLLLLLSGSADQMLRLLKNISGTVISQHGSQVLRRPGSSLGSID